MHTATLTHSSAHSTHEKAAIDQNSRTCDLVTEQPGRTGEMLKYLPTQASIGSGCGGYKVRACAGYRILFSWGISSVFKSDRVLAINDDAVFLGGRAALII